MRSYPPLPSHQNRRITAVLSLAGVIVLCLAAVIAVAYFIQVILFYLGPPENQPAPAAGPTASPAAVEASPAAPTISPDDGWVSEKISAMNINQKVGQLLLIAIEGQFITAETCAQIKRLSPGGIVFTRQNVTSPQQLRQFSAAIQRCAADASLPPLFTAIDHEGQYVNHFSEGVTIFPCALAQGASNDPVTVQEVAQAAGSELAYGGVNLILGPDADVLSNFDNSTISERSFGSDPLRTARMTAAAVNGYLQAGLTPALKHFPGHGGTTGDSHLTLPVDPIDAAKLQSDYLPPFESGFKAGAQAIILSHAAFPSLDPAGKPASLSPAMFQMLRQQIGFQGIAISDTSTMGPLANASGSSAALESLNAGSDMLLVSDYTSTEILFARLLAAAQTGDLPAPRLEEALRHVLSVKSVRGLKDLPAAPETEPDWIAHGLLAQKISNKAVTLYRDQHDLLPIPKDKRTILIIGPTDGWGLYPVVQQALSAQGHLVEVVAYSGPWNGPVPEAGYLTTLPQQAALYDLVLVFTWNAHLSRITNNDQWQGILVNRLLDAGYPLVVVALKSPTDLIEFPGAPVYLATLGTTRPQINALASALTGEWSPAGQNPLPGLSTLR